MAINSKKMKKPASKDTPRKENALKNKQFTEDEYDMLYDGERFKILFEEALDAVYITNRNGIIMDLNRAGCELLGYLEEEIIGMNIESAYGNQEDRVRLISALKRTGRVRDFEIVLKKKDGVPLICLLNTFVRNSKSGEIIGYQGIIRDITKSRQLELSLKTEYERAEFYNDLMSHDINNFNQGAMSNLELLLFSRELSEKDKRYVNNTMSQIISSTNLISNLRTLQAIKSGEIVSQKVNALELLEDAILKSRALFPGTEITIEIVGGTQDTVVVGSMLLLEAFVNLITNAIKFNHSHKVEIGLLVSSHESGYLKIEFKDNGPGIEDSMKQKIFDRSLRLHPEMWGTGLGLTLVKTIIESCGGCIYVENRVKDDHTQGSNFIVILRRGY